MQIFRHIGQFIGQWPVQVLAATALLFLPLLSRFLIFPFTMVTDIRRGFAHVGGRSSQELKVFAEFYNVTRVENIEIVILAMESNDRGASRLAMNSRMLDEVARVDRFFKRLSVPSLVDSSKRISVADIESPRGDLNFVFSGFKWALGEQEERLAENRSLDATIKLDFPVSEIWGHQAPLYAHFFNPRLRDTPKQTPQHPTSIESVETVALWYMLEIDAVHTNRAKLQNLELQLLDAIRDESFSPLLSVVMYGDELGNYEMMRGSEQCGRMLAVGMILMLAFMSLALRRFSWRAQLILVPSAIFSPLLAISTTFAVLGWLGVEFNSVMSIMPFLVLGIGVDDAFLLLHSWRKWSLKGGGEFDNAARRMTEVMGEIGPSICITSLTNTIAFGIGVLSPSRIMSAFCLATMIAIALDFLFQLVFFTPCMVLSERWAAARLAPSTAVGGGSALDVYWRRYARFVGSKGGRALCAALLAILYALAFFGVRRMEARFEPSKSFAFDSPLLDSTRLINRVYVEYTPVLFIVGRPPDVSDQQDLAAFFDFIAKLEAHPRSYGPVERTQLWLRDYLDYDRRHHPSTQKAGANNQSHPATAYVPSYQLLPNFLSDHLLDDKHVVLYHHADNNATVVSKGDVVVDSFVFMLVFRGYVDWHERAAFINEMRDIVDAHGAQFNVTLFDYDSTIFDLIMSVKPELAKAVLITLASMTVVTFFIIPHVKHTGMAILNVVSICYTLLGALSWWGLDYDPVTMITMLMAIGYSVDYSAHICYHHHKMQQKATALSTRGKQGDAVATERMEEILKAVGRPMLEAASSTLICMIPLFFVRIYIVSSFAKTCVSVVLLGLLHGIFVLPVVLLLDRQWLPCCSGAEHRTPRGDKKPREEGDSLVNGTHMTTKA